jgi:hypothetical protein
LAPPLATEVATQSSEAGPTVLLGAWEEERAAL